MNRIHLVTCSRCADKIDALAVGRRWRVDGSVSWGGPHRQQVDRVDPEDT